MSGPKIIGVTGIIGSGKSLVGKILEDLSVPVIDTDKVVHYLLSADTPTRQSVIERFGETIRMPDGTIDRRALGKIVFSDATARKELESIVHPAVRAECKRQISELNDARMVAVLVPLLFEAGLAKEYDEIWSVFAEEDVLRARLKQRDKMTDEELNRRIGAQWSQAKKAELAHRVIDNSATPAETRKQVETLVQSQLASLS